MYLLENVFTNEHGEAITVLQLLTKFKSVLSEIDTYLNEYGNRLNSIELKNSEQDADILILKSQVASLQTKVNNIQLTLGDYLLRFNDLDGQLSVINSKIDINITDISNLETNVNNIGIQIININNTLNLLNLTVQGHTSSISSLDTNLNLLNDNVASISTNVSSHTTAINNLTEELTTISLTVNNLQNSIVSINESVTFINNQILTINTSIENLDDRVNILENNSIGNVGYEGNIVSPFSQKSANTITTFGKTPVTEIHDLIIEEYVFFIACSTGTDTNMTFTTCLGSKLLTFPTLTGTSNIIKVSYTVFSKFDGINLFVEELIDITADNTFVKSVSTSSFNDMVLQSSTTWNDRLKIQLNKLYLLSPIKYNKHDVELLT